MNARSVASRLALQSYPLLNLFQCRIAPCHGHGIARLVLRSPQIYSYSFASREQACYHQQDCSPATTQIQDVLVALQFQLIEQLCPDFKFADAPQPDHKRSQLYNTATLREARWFGVGLQSFSMLARTHAWAGCSSLQIGASRL